METRTGTEWVGRAERDDDPRVAAEQVDVVNPMRLQEVIGLEAWQRLVGLALRAEGNRPSEQQQAGQIPERRAGPAK